MSLFRRDEFEEWVYIDFDALYQLCNEKVRLFAEQYDLSDKKYTKDLDLLCVHYIISEILTQESLPICFVSGVSLPVAKKVHRFIPIIIDETEFSKFEPSVATRVHHSIKIPHKQNNIKKLTEKLTKSKLTQISDTIKSDFNISAALTKY